MASRNDEVRLDLSGIWERVQKTLKDKGIDLQVPDSCCVGGEEGGRRVRVVCVAPDLKETVDEMSRTSRDQVVMVRVDADTCRALDAWVETGAVKSRSEAAALFIKEGLALRRDELAKLEEALAEVEAARDRLRRKADEVFGSRAKG